MVSKSTMLNISSDLWCIRFLYKNIKDKLCPVILLLLPIQVQGSVFRRIIALWGSGSLEWVVESTTVTHSSADWWDLLLPLA